uniref:Asic n=1 Tax=Schmidtea mediterranea TaxID=79327 RepID=S5W2R2_SCHMD|nr:asic [Schmidtea mediterranea]
MIDLIQSSTIHGIGHIFSATNKIFKVLWCILFLVGVIAIIVNIVFISMKFLSNPVIISYTFEHEPFIWPDITFCNPTDPYAFTINSQPYLHWIETLNKTKRVAGKVARQTSMSQLIHSRRENDYELEERTIAMSSADPAKLQATAFQNYLYRIGYIKAHKGLYFSKEFQSSSTKLNEDWKSLFTSQIVQMRNNIPCHTFHLDKSRIVKQKFIKSLLFRFKLNEESYKIFNSSYTFQSMFLYISNKDEIPQSNEIILTPGYNNVVQLTQNRHSYTGLRRTCRNEKFEAELYDSLLQSTEKYSGSYDDCKKIVSQQKYVKYCNCYNSFLPIFKNSSGFPRLCLNASIFSEAEVLKNAKCMINTFRKYAESDKARRRFYNRCKMYRPIPCNKVLYKIDHRKEILVDLWSKSTNDRRREIIKTLYLKTFQTNETSLDFVEKVKDNIMQLIINRDNESGDLYKEEREYPFSELLSDVGGLMGLWLGLSVIGLFEIVEFVY